MQPSRVRERGDVLITALLAMSVGILLALPVVHFVSTRLNTTRRIAETLGGQYAQDAGVEYAIWRIESDAAFRQQLMNSPSVTHTLALPGAVNAANPVIEVIRLQAPLWTYSIWVSDTLTINANNTRVYGDIHSNGDIWDLKNNTQLYGAVTYVGSRSNTAALSHAQRVSPQQVPIPFQIEDFRPGGSWAVRAASEGRYFERSSLTVGSTLAPGLYYVTGAVQFTDSNSTIEGITVVAEGTITINQTANKVTFRNPYVPGLLFFSNSTSPRAVYIDGNKETMLEGGLVYAPSGTIEIAGNSLTTAGFFVSKSLVVSKNNLTVDNNVIAPGGGLDLGLTEPIYDIRATTAGGSRTTARLRQRGANLEIVAWDVR